MKARVGCELPAGSEDGRIRNTRGERSRRDLTRPVMRFGTGFHTDQTRVPLSKKIEQGSLSQLLLQNNAPIRIRPVKLENVLGEINPECCLTSAPMGQI